MPTSRPPATTTACRRCASTSARVPWCAPRSRALARRRATTRYGRPRQRRVPRARRPPGELDRPSARDQRNGLPGSGKTVVAQRMLELVGAVRVRSDVERKRMFGLGALQSSRGRVDGGIYDAASTARTYRAAARGGAHRARCGLAGDRRCGLPASLRARGNSLRSLRLGTCRSRSSTATHRWPSVQQRLAQRRGAGRRCLRGRCRRCSRPCARSRSR
jgi:hypothetical protein